MLPFEIGENDFRGNYCKGFRLKKDLINRSLLNIYFYLENNLSLSLQFPVNAKLLGFEWRGGGGPKLDSFTSNFNYCNLDNFIRNRKPRFLIWRNEEMSA